MGGELAWRRWPGERVQSVNGDENALVEGKESVVESVAFSTGDAFHTRFTSNLG